MRAANTIVSSGLAALLCLGLAGCAPSGPESPTPTATRTASMPSETPPEPQPETPVAGEQPESRYGLECNTLVDPALVTAVFSTRVSAVDPLVTASGVGIAIPRRTSILSVGGTVCEWSNGVAMNDQYGYVPDYVGVIVSVPPRPDTGWSSAATNYNMPSTARYCNASWLCTMDTVASDAWVTLEAAGGDGRVLNPVAADALFAAVVAAVEAAGPAKPAATPVRDRPALPSDCEAVLPLDTARSISEVTAPEPWLGGGGGWSDWAEAMLHAGTDGCAWMSSDDGLTVAFVNWVRDGRWGYVRALDAGTFEPVTVTGLGTGDYANLRCNSAEFGQGCAVDLAIGPDWVNVYGADEPTAIAFAEAVVAQVTR